VDEKKSPLSSCETKKVHRPVIENRRKVSNPVYWTKFHPLTARRGEAEERGKEQESVKGGNAEAWANSDLEGRFRTAEGVERVDIE